MSQAHLKEHQHVPPYLSALGAWALAFGCSVGWGSFVMPGTTFLPVAGPVGTILGMAFGAVVMLILAMNYHYLMNQYPDGGGTYTYTKYLFGYDQGFLSGWFLVLTYIAILWANATALPLIARTLLGSAFQFGFEYTIAGFHIYMGEILLAVSALVIGALVCLRREWAVQTQIIMGIVLFIGVVFCFLAATVKQTGGPGICDPPYSPENTSIVGIFTIFALTPWAFVGFESVSHSVHEAKFNRKHSFLIMAIAVVTAGIVYIFLSLLATTVQPEGCSNWVDYIANLGSYSGLASHPTFYAGNSAMGTIGSVLLGIAALCGIFTGLIGNYIALSRLIFTLAEDGMVPEWIGRLDKNHTPRCAILSIMCISVILPFFGRTAISWIVDVTTVGATISYSFTSAAAWKKARADKKSLVMVTGALGFAMSMLFAFEFLMPNILGITTLSTESYLILALWGILGFVVFRFLLRNDKERRLGRSTFTLMILLTLVMFTSFVWMYQSIVRSMQSEMIAAGHETSMVNEMVNQAVGNNSIVQVLIVVTALVVLFSIYSFTQKREKQIEREKTIAEESSQAKTSFLSNMSHEIRTPMNAIIGLDNIALRNPDLDTKTREQLEKIGVSAKHLLGLINDILDMSRIESGRMVLKNEEFSFHEFLDQINIIINGQCVDKGLNYDCKIVGNVSDYYFGDDMKLKQILINVLGNSVKFTEAPGEVTLTVEQLTSFEGRCKMRFVARDTGIGMDKEYIPKIFDAFSQENSNATNRYGGTGLGMAITKNLVNMMNGEIQVDSEKGVGTVFTITVTLKASNRSIQIVHGMELPKDLRALVVDDDEIACEHAQIVLRAIGIEAETCTQSEEAARRAQEAFRHGKPYQLILTDYKMPGMNGLELVKEIRKFDNDETVIFMLTGYRWDTIELESKGEHIDGIIVKPLFSDSLSREICSILEKKGILESEDEEEEMSLLDAKAKSILEGSRVLIAEDVDQNAEVLEDLLSLEGVLAEHARNGSIAIDMFNERPEGYYNAIIMDVRMPVMDGLTATKAIRSLTRADAKTIPIIAMTADVFDEDIEKSLQAGMNAHLSKPIEPENLYKTLARMIGNLKK